MGEQDMILYCVVMARKTGRCQGWSRWSEKIMGRNGGRASKLWCNMTVYHNNTQITNNDVKKTENEQTQIDTQHRFQRTKTVVRHEQKQYVKAKTTQNKWGNVKQ